MIWDGGVIIYSADEYFNEIIMNTDGIGGCGFIISQKAFVNGKWAKAVVYSYSDEKIRKKKNNANSPYLESSQAYESKISAISEFLNSNSKLEY